MPGSSDHCVNSGMEKIQTTIAKAEKGGKCTSKPCCDLSCPEYSGNLRYFCLYLSDCII